MSDPVWIHVRVWRGSKTFDIQIEPNRRAIKWRYRKAMIGHYWRWMTNPIYRHVWRIDKEQENADQTP